jgi:hypothetical protein
MAERFLGKGEVESSILSGSTTKTLKITAKQLVRVNGNAGSKWNETRRRF